MGRRLANQGQERLGVIPRQRLSTLKAEPGGRGLLGLVTKRELWESLAHFTECELASCPGSGVATFPLTPWVQGRALSIAVQLGAE